VSNSASVGGGVHFSTANNCVIYYNTASHGPNSWSSTLNYCCTPDPGTGNITNEPGFLDPSGGNFHLQSNSPCINSGRNTYISSGTDLDGNPRVVAGTVDIGAYEYQAPLSALSYAWAQKYGLPTDGSADKADTDGDGMNNWQEWVAGTNPTNAGSTLRMLAPSNSASGLVVQWTAVSDRTYFLEQATSLGDPFVFSEIASNLVGRSQFTDTNALGGRAAVYRVGVQPQ
jgi:hypothetical protein